MADHGPQPLGSTAFGVSAIASFVVPTTGLPRNVALVNLAMFGDPVCFFAGAALLLLPTQADSDRKENRRGSKLLERPTGSLIAGFLGNLTLIAAVF